MLQDFELSGTGVMLSILLLCIATMALIWFFKIKYSKINPDALTEKVDAGLPSSLTNKRDHVENEKSGI